MRQFLTDFLTPEEAEAIDVDLSYILHDTDAAVTVTYHSMGAESTNDTTGAVTETGGSNISSVVAVKVTPREEEDRVLKHVNADEVYLILASDLSAVTPKTNDYIVLGTTKKYIRWFTKPLPFKHYKFYVADVGDG